MQAFNAVERLDKVDLYNDMMHYKCDRVSLAKSSAADKRFSSFPAENPMGKLAFRMFLHEINVFSLTKSLLENISIYMVINRTRCGIYDITDIHEQYLYESSYRRQYASQGLDHRKEIYQFDIQKYGNPTDAIIMPSEVNGNTILTFRKKRMSAVLIVDKGTRALPSLGL